MVKAKRKLYTGKRGGKYYVRKGRKVYINSKKGAWGTAEQRLWVANRPDHAFNM